jgi:hypothetical protein
MHVGMLHARPPTPALRPQAGRSVDAATSRSACSPDDAGEPHGLKLLLASI